MEEVAGLALFLANRKEGGAVLAKKGGARAPDVIGPGRRSKAKGCPCNVPPFPPKGRGSL
ncbi:hypothetical protein CSW14_02310 [Thermus scotoductus]|uniref:Uncharacterized protein n=1 Tax=Thermus scotoductus TaxID=37636 RepID=A0A430VUI7_THESC|nr:hypothetical protein CSW14_02310 [Thermus scotoductus]